MTTAVRRVAQYLHKDSTRVYTHHDFCGACGYLIGSTFGRLLTVDHLDENGSTHEAEGDGYSHILFCPWCGDKFGEEWWKERLTENARLIDHFDCPGTHVGDTHEFHGSPAGHWLSSTSDRICWCDPIVEPDITGCRIIHLRAA